MKKIILSLALILLLGPLSGLDAQPPMRQREKVITPYGDFCSKCSKYGRGGRQVKMREAMDAVEAYFNLRGLTAKHIRGKKRFLVIDVYKEDKIVDTILFDRRTGRLRSIY